MTWYDGRVKRFVGVLALVALLATGCAGKTATSTTAATPSATPSSPSASALMVCSAEAQADIQGALGVAVSRPPDSSYVGGVYTCTYPYTAGKIVMTVRDLGNEPAAVSYLAQARAGIAKPTDLAGIGDAAFSDGDSTVFVRKDLKVLKVDATGMPATFGQPPHPRSTVAVTVAILVMLCWTGA